MPEVTLAEAATRYATALKESARAVAIPELNRFVRWYGPERLLSGLRGHDVSLYADVLGPANAESSRRADFVRSFLVWLKKDGLAASNFAPHLRLRKGNKFEDIPGAAPTTVELTADGIEALQTEIESLKAQRPKIREEIRRAMLDKDFRENAPLDAAKDKQGHLEARVREVEHTLKQAVIVEAGQQGSPVHVGST